MCLQITGIGLKSVFSLISQARFSNAQFCEQALIALLDILQGHAPEELAQEPTEVSIYLLRRPIVYIKEEYAKSHK